MSQKITAKNLSYDSSLPPFLAALRAQAAGHAQSPTPQRRGAAKKRSASEEREDAPLVVDEHGNTVDLDDLEKAREEPTSGADEDAEPSRAGSAKQQDDGSKLAAEAKSATSVGAGKKRKVGKKVGGETDAADAIEKEGRRERKNDEDDGGGGGAKREGPAKAAKTSQTKASMGKKKAKKIKLSFDEAEG